jgi:hypothetical protein
MKCLIVLIALTISSNLALGQRIGFGVSGGTQWNQISFNGVHVETGKLRSYGFNNIRGYAEPFVFPYVFLDLDNRWRFDLKVNPIKSSLSLSGKAPKSVFDVFLSDEKSDLGEYNSLFFINAHTQNWRLLGQANYALFELKKFKFDLFTGAGYTAVPSSFVEDPTVGSINLKPEHLISVSAIENPTTDLIKEDLELVHGNFFNSNYFSLKGYFHWQLGLAVRYQNIHLGLEYGSSFLILNDVQNTFRRFYWAELNLAFDLLSTPLNYKRKNERQSELNFLGRKNYFAFQIGSIVHLTPELNETEPFIISSEDNSNSSYVGPTSYLLVNEKGKYNPRGPSLGITLNHTINSKIWLESFLKWQRFNYSYQNSIIGISQFGTDGTSSIFHLCHFGELGQAINYNFIDQTKLDLFVGGQLSANTFLYPNQSSYGFDLEYNPININYGLSLGLKYKMYALKLNYSRSMLNAIRENGFNRLGKFNNINFSLSIPLL